MEFELKSGAQYEVIEDMAWLEQENAYQTYGIYFISILLPQGVPLLLAPFMVLLKLIFYSFCTMSSFEINLFFNLIASHGLTKILSKVVGTMLSIKSNIYVTNLVLILTAFLTTNLELGVAILQA